MEVSAFGHPVLSVSLFLIVGYDLQGLGCQLLTPREPLKRLDTDTFSGGTLRPPVAKIPQPPESSRFSCRKEVRTRAKPRLAQGLLSQCGVVKPEAFSLNRREQHEARKQDEV